VVCDSYVSPCTLVRICDECNYGSYAGRCVICGNRGISDAYYCTECTKCEKDVRARYSSLLRANTAWLSAIRDRCCCCLLFVPLLCVVPPQRDGCPKVVNLGTSKTDLFYERKKYGFKKR